MGAKDSKPNFITYEEAVKRVPDSELRRIREAFKRCAGANGVALSLESFVRDVLNDGVPFEVAEWLYQACGGTKRGIAFRDLLCGLVVLTKGSLDEKIKLLWTLYANYQNDNGMHLYKRDFALALHFENNSLPVSASHKTAETLNSLFGPSEKVSYEQFRSWLLIHKQATVLSKWLLSERPPAIELETPTFYQSLAGVTHLEERDIIDLEKSFWSLCAGTTSGQLDLAAVSSLLSPPLPRSAVKGAFLAFDENRDGHIDFKELCCGLSAACRGPRTERLKFCFKMFDLDRDGVLNNTELEHMVEVMCSVANDSLKYNSRSSTPSECSTASDTGTERCFDRDGVLANLRDKLVPLPRTPLFRLGPVEDTLSHQQPQQTEGSPVETALPLEEFLIWAVESGSAVVSPLMELLVEECLLVLGLRPQCPHQERDCVLGWLSRSVSRGYSVGQFWYLVGSEWWARWLQYCGGTCTHHRHEDMHCDDSDTTHSSAESMGSLLWRGADSASVGSASSSGVSSATPRHRPHPGPIDNKRLLAPNTLKVRTLTGEGGHLRRDVTLAQHRDFELLPDQLWRALALWYGGPDPLPRQVIRPPNSDVELELYPLHLKLLRHVPSSQRVNCVAAAAVGGGGAAFVPVPPDRQLAYTAAFSRLATVRQVSEFLSCALCIPREDMRLWCVNTSAGSVLLEDETETLEALPSHTALLIEVRNADLTWPEEIGALGLASATRASVSAAGVRRDTLALPNLPGATGLHNLGNTCYMNAALQAVWNTGPLTRYFNTGMHLYEVNQTNPLGTKGALALRYGELCKEVWSCSARSVAPLRVRWCVSRHARHLASGQQHDAQELLAWLLDALHEDLNRVDVTAAQTIQCHDSDGRPDQVVATEAWTGHVSRNQSIVTDLFYGQLKSKVTCDVCGRDSTRFDAFNMLSLPLPMECKVRAEVTVILLDGSVPVKYGARINADGTYLELKNKLSELCGLPPEELLIVELSGATISRSLPDSSKVNAATATQLHAYQIPALSAVPRSCDDEAYDDDHQPSPSEVSAPRRVARSRCMPALFCFKRTRSEAAMSGSPPAMSPSTVFRSNTLPRDLSDLKRLEPVPRSPTLSVRSLTRPSPRLPRRTGANTAVTGDDPLDTGEFLVAVHRKQSRSATYFLPSARVTSAVFGTPLLVRLHARASGRQLYADVWTQVNRLLSKRPNTDHHNHATDCDDSLGYEFPFTLRIVCAAGVRCAQCPWWRQCNGCALPQDDRPLVYLSEDDELSPVPGDSGEYSSSEYSSSCGESLACDSPIARVKLQRQASGCRPPVEGLPDCGGELRRLEVWKLRRQQRRVQLAIDWDPTALHLRYQTTNAKAWTEHESVASCVTAASRPVDLAVCLRAFTSEERLEQRYHCTGCRAAQPATKKLQIWRAPPILVIHLKRFQYVNNKWIKSQKVVTFPFQDFDPTEYLAAVPQETILRHRDITRPRHSMMIDETISESDSDSEPQSPTTKDPRPKPKPERRCRSPASRQRLQSTSLVNTPVTDDNLVDYHQHHLKSEQDAFDLKYRLYAVVCHSGQLHGGHYVCYARNPSGTWLCYNDSTCRVLATNGTPHIDPANAYLLFYERQGLDYEAYLPDTNGRQPVVRDCDPDPDEADLRKMCVIA